MVSDLSAAIFLLTLAGIALFIFWLFHSPKQRSLLSKLYLWLVLVYSYWAVLMLIMWRTPPDHIEFLAFLDSLTYLGISIPAIYLMISLVFVQGRDRLPKWTLSCLVVPVLAVIVCHDAMRVRLETGRQAAAINRLLRESREPSREVLKEFVGHTPAQVAVGALIGGANAFLMHRLLFL